MNEYILNDEYFIGWTSNTNKEFYFDIDDYQRIKNYKWRESQNNWNNYIVTKINGKHIYLHRLIMNAEKGEYIDHIDRNTFNNCKRNLRKCSNAENARNQRINKNNNSGFTGVYWSKKDESWYAQITVDGQKIHLGYCKTFEEAIYKRLLAESKYFKEFAPQRELFKDYGIEVHYENLSELSSS